MIPSATPGFSVVPVTGVPMVKTGDNLIDIIEAALADNVLKLEDGDIVCIAQKIVSKAEGRQVALADVTASEEAVQLARETEKDPRMVELILSESTEVLRKKPGVLIMRHKLGLVGAHAGIDQSNVDHSDGEQALLLPENPDASAAAICAALRERSGKQIGVLITDSQNRPWRMGTTGCAIGCAGFTVLDDHRGGSDVYGRELRVTLINRADSIAAAATLVMGETTDKIPLALVRGLPGESLDATASQNAAMINRPLEEDLFR